MKNLIYSVITIMMICSIKSGQIATDITSFTSDSHTGKSQVICHYHVNTSTDLRTFASAVFDTKQKAIDFYKLIAPNWSTEDRSSITYATTTLTNNGAITNYSNPLCVLRTNNLSPSAISVPAKTYLTGLSNFLYYYFPSIEGYHPKGGTSIYTHVREIQIPYTSSSISYTAKLMVFTAQYKNAYSAGLADYNALTGTNLRAFWGPYYRYEPFPEVSLINEYYIYPRMKRGTENFDFTAASFTITLSSGNATIVNNFLTQTSFTPGSTPGSCNFTSTNVFIMRKSKNCSVVANNLTCTPDKSNISYTSNNTFLSGTVGLAASNNICVDTHGVLWLVLSSN